MTYRERRERRAARLREWAEKREQRAEAGFTRAREMADAIPFGQPIIAGHYSQGRDTRYRERIQRTGLRALEDARKAESMSSRADNIEAQAANAIYSDDPDAVEQLRAKLERLEAEREAMKARNAAYKKAHKAELAAITSAYQRNHALPHPSYELQNLGGTISRTRKRLAQMERAV